MQGPRRARGVFALGAALAFVSACALAGVAIAQSTSPGPLARSHKKIEGPSRCGKCHLRGKGVVDRLCLDCHDKVRRSKFHSAQVKRAGVRCARCHRDHKGRGFRMIRWRPPRGFDHGQTGHDLKGAHAKLDCAACHRLPGRWMGVGTRCVDCHRDPHAPSLGRACDRCHGEVKFKRAPRFDHARSAFPLKGKHVKVACARCHPGKGARAKFRGLAFKTCASCHKDPVPDHSGGGAGSGRRREDCGACHTNEAWGAVSRRAALAMHDQLKMKLTGKHRPLKCAQCHKARTRPGPDPVSRLGAFRGLSTPCAGCHKDPHAGRMGKRCERCHDDSGWKGRKVRVGFDHERTKFPLRGAHATVRCKACHKGKGSYDKRFGGQRFDRCTRCHADPHGGPFKSVPSGDRCETCHDARSFAPARYELADHERTAFALERAHRVVACNLCHKPAPVVREAPPSKRRRRRRLRRGRRVTSTRSTPRRVAKLRGVGKDCRDCHKDPHGGQFSGEQRKARCSDCHNQGSFRSFRFEHDKTRFKLLGRHAKVPCAGCHLRPAPDRPVRFAGTPDRCGSCHPDPHGGQFASAGPVRGCADCHRKITEKFVISGFDHARTRFALRGRHAKARCGVCHKKVDGIGPEAKVHWRLGEPACEDCHANPHVRSAGQRRQRGGDMR